MSELALRLIEENKKTRDPYLDLGRCGLTELPKELGECVWVETLILSTEWYEVDLTGEDWQEHKSRNEGVPNSITFWASLDLQSCTMFAHKGRSWSFDQDQNITDLPNFTML